MRGVVGNQSCGDFCCECCALCRKCCVTSKLKLLGQRISSFVHDFPFANIGFCWYRPQQASKRVSLLRKTMQLKTNSFSNTALLTSFPPYGQSNAFHNKPAIALSIHTLAFVKPSLTKYSSMAFPPLPLNNPASFHGMSQTSRMISTIWTSVGSTTFGFVKVCSRSARVLTRW